MQTTIDTDRNSAGAGTCYRLVKCKIEARIFEYKVRKYIGFILVSLSIYTYSDSSKNLCNA